MSGPAQRVLYKTIHLRIHRYTLDPGHIFTNLVHTLSQNPRLGMYVSTLSIISRNVSLDPRPRGHEEFLFLMPRLRTVLIVPTLLHCQLSNKSLPCVKTLGLDFSQIPSLERKYGEDAMTVIARQFCAPNLRGLYIYRTYFTPQKSVSFPAERYRTSPITDLRLRECDERIVNDLLGIILYVKTLKRFTLEFLTRSLDFHLTSDTIVPVLIGQLIRIHAKTLVQVEIAASDAATFLYTSTIGSLVGYSNIRRLAIPEPFLVVKDDEATTFLEMLPPNLKELQPQFPLLYMHNEDTEREVRIKRLEQLAAVKTVRFPALREVAWWTQPTAHWTTIPLKYTLSDMEHLEETFNMVGVKFNWTITACFESSPFGEKDDSQPWGHHHHG